MSKDIKYTSANLLDIKNLRQRIHLQIDELRIQKRIIDGQIEKLLDVRDALDRHISSIEKMNEEGKNDICM